MGPNVFDYTIDHVSCLASLTSNFFILYVCNYRLVQYYN
jgi:hypothetical protein